ncbi:MAG: PPC domain-containing DNA-binding protein [Candidatus Adiutrix sp.]
MEGFLENNSSVLYLRLAPGMDLLEGIKNGCTEYGVQYGTITSCLGSLSQTAYTFVQRNPDNVSGIAYRKRIISDKPNELICAQGTIGLSGGEMDVHLHAVMCDVDGTIFAGHMLPGCLICATMEISIAPAMSGTIVRNIDEVMKLPLFRFSPQRSYVI